MRRGTLPLTLPGGDHFELPTLSRSAVEFEGFELIEPRAQSLRLDGSILITGEVDRTTEFEQGFPGHEVARAGSGCWTRGSSTTRCWWSMSGTEG